MAAPLPLSSKLVPRLQLLTHRFKTSRFLSPVSSSFLQPSTALPTSRRNFSLTAASMSYDKLVVKDAAENRRSIYALTKKSPVSDKRIEEIVHSAIKHVPSSFNSQSTRLVVLLKDDHDKFWDTTTEILKAIVPEDAWGHTEGRLKGFRGAYGTILFYEDPEPVRKLQSAFAQYADKFPTWSEHTSAMHQYFLWTSLEAEGFGANLQHYNPLPDQKASEIWNVPLDWSLKAQLVFGGLAEGARDNLKEKTYEPIEKRVFIHGA